MRTIVIMTACATLAGCAADSPAALQSPDIRDMSVTGNYAGAIGAQLRTAADIARDVQAGPQPRPVVTRPAPNVTCVSPGYSVPTTGC